MLIVNLRELVKIVFSFFMNSHWWVLIWMKVRLTFYNLDIIGRNTNFKPYYLTWTVGSDIRKEWNWTQFECTWVHQIWNKIWCKWSYICVEEEIISVLEERDDAAVNEPIKEVGIVQIGDVVDIVGFNVAKSALVTLKQLFEQRYVDVTPLIQSIQTLQKETWYWRAQETHQTSSDSFFHYA